MHSCVSDACRSFVGGVDRCSRQWRDLAYCLSMLTYSEKSVRKLQENFTCFHDKLHDEDVYNSFMAIIGGARKLAKPEAKVRRCLRLYGVIFSNSSSVPIDVCSCEIRAQHDDVISECSQFSYSINN